jgi:DNA modification methylase
MRLLEQLRQAIQDQRPVSGSTHDFYKYPARFSPAFARSAILAFTKPGDLVLDPFLGGGTSAVEATLLGRRAAGTDISSLAVFISRAKTARLTYEQLDRVEKWGNEALLNSSLRQIACRYTERGGIDYQRNINTRAAWPIRKLLGILLEQVASLRTAAESDLARCVLLRTAQWALDCRRDIPTVDDFREELSRNLTDMIVASREYQEIMRAAGTQLPLCLQVSATRLHESKALATVGVPSLVLTSPPYPGVHILYHRWQVLGRRETPAPFWIAGASDGAGASFYTFGSRSVAGLSNYYNEAAKAFASLARIVSRKTIIVQMLAFVDPPQQLPAYLQMMRSCGFVEKRIPEVANGSDGRAWRSVPNRRWYADANGKTSSSKEVVLFHRKQY